MLCDDGEGYEGRRSNWLHSEASGCVSADNRFSGSLYVLAEKESKDVSVSINLVSKPYDLLTLASVQSQTIFLVSKEAAIKELMQIPSVGKSIANDLWNIGITEVSALRGKNPEDLFYHSNKLVGVTQDRCLLYSFRCAVYYAETEVQNRDPELLKWWNWKDPKKIISK